MTPAKRNQGIQHRERQTPWRYGRLALSDEQVHNDTLITEFDGTVVGAMIMLVENQIVRMMGK